MKAVLPSDSARTSIFRVSSWTSSPTWTAESLPQGFEAPTAEGDDTAPTAGMISQYVKDLSFENEGGLALGLGANLDLQGQFVDVLTDLDGRDVELHVDICEGSVVRESERARHLSGADRAGHRRAVQHLGRPEREEQARRFAQHEGLDLVDRHVAEAEETGIAEVDDEGDLSFENPNAPAIYQAQTAPGIDVQFNISAVQVGGAALRPA
jgi:hypothetical protein